MNWYEQAALAAAILIVIRMLYARWAQKKERSWSAVGFMSKELATSTCF